MTDPFVHRIRVRYAEVDGQGVVFNAHWLTYCDDACTRFMESMGFGTIWIDEFDVMLVKAVLEWQGPAGFDELVDIGVAVSRIGTRSFDVRYTAAVGERPACTGTITYVSVAPGTHDSTAIPDGLRARLETELVATP